MLRTRLFSIVLLTASMTLIPACAKKEQTGGEPSSAAGPAPEVRSASGTATIEGTVSFEGTPPAEAPINMNSDPVCASLHKAPVYPEDIVVSGKHLSNVFVYVKHGLEQYSFSPPAEPAVLNQEGCGYSPHVFGMMVNQDLRIMNSDPALHNVHCQAEKNPSFNIGQPLKDMVAVKRFATPEVMIHFKCDVHKWMSAYLGVLPHPYFGVTGNDGTFAFKNLPPGEYVIEAWHEKLGTQSRTVKVGEKETKEIGFSFKETS